MNSSLYASKARAIAITKIVNHRTRFINRTTNNLSKSNVFSPESRAGCQRASLASQHSYAMWRFYHSLIKLKRLYIAREDSPQRWDIMVSPAYVRMNRRRTVEFASFWSLKRTSFTNMGQIYAYWKIQHFDIRCCAEASVSPEVAVSNSSPSLENTNKKNGS